PAARSGSLPGGTLPFHARGAAFAGEGAAAGGSGPGRQSAVCLGNACLDGRYGRIQLFWAVVCLCQPAGGRLQSASGAGAGRLAYSGLFAAACAVPAALPFNISLYINRKGPRNGKNSGCGILFVC